MIILRLILVSLTLTKAAADIIDVPPDISPDPYVFTSTRLPNFLGIIVYRYMASVGNGHLATNAFSDTVYMNGLYNGYKDYIPYRARIPAHISFRVNVSKPVQVYNTRYSLDVKHGYFRQWINSSVGIINQTIYAHQVYRVLISTVTVERSPTIVNETGPITVIVKSGRGADSTDITFGAPTQYGAAKKQTGQINIAETSTSGRTEVTMYWTPKPSKLVLPIGVKSKTWTFVMAADSNSTKAKRDFDAVMQLLNKPDGASELLESHTNIWQNIWSRGRIVVTGDLKLAKIINGAMYYLYSSLPAMETYTPNNQFYGLSPGGLANGKNGSDYNGHAFWDMETWMYPPILMFRPDLAREMLSYRIHGMLPAMERAQSGGYRGARYPWESAYTGTEVCTTNFIGRENEQHITGDIAFAVRQYISSTHDVHWLNTSVGVETNNFTGYQFIRKMAEFWYTRPSWSNDKKLYEINGIMPPDEYQASVNNSVYTNALASLSMHFARYAACLNGQNVNDPLNGVPDRWLHVADNLYFAFNKEKRYHEEYEGYDKAKDKKIKQADAVLLGFPLMWSMSEDVRRNDLEIYENVTDPGGPAMTWGMYSIGWMELGNKTKADDLFNQSYNLYVREPFKIWTEVKSGLGAVNFLTGVGGFLQAVMFGYGGLRLKVESLEFLKPSLPKGVTEFKFADLEYMGVSFDMRINVTHVRLDVSRMSVPTNLTIKMAAEAESYPFSTGSIYEFAKQKFTIKPDKSSGCPLPADTLHVNYNKTEAPPVNTKTPSGEQSACSLVSKLISRFLGLFAI